MNSTEIKIMKQKPQLTDEEIRSHMNFDKLLELKAASVGVASTSLNWLTIVAYVAPAVTIISAILYFTWPDATETQANQNQNQASPGFKDSTASITATPPNETVFEQVEEKPLPRPALKQENPKQAEPQQEASKIGIAKFTQAEPVDGYPALYEYFNRELKYPLEMANDSIEGTVTVSFAINELGKPGAIRISNSLGAAFDKESIRIIENMPAWRAATIDGKATETRMSIPLTFRIEKK